MQARRRHTLRLPAQVLVVLVIFGIIERADEPTHRRRPRVSAQAKPAPEGAVSRAASAADPGTIGQWGPGPRLPVKGIHVIVLPGGKGLLFSYPVAARGSDGVVWDPMSGHVKDVSLNYDRDIFCASHTILSDGRVFLAGGHVHGADSGLGVKDTDYFDPATGTFAAGPRMSHERWYPTSVQLGNDKVLIFGGARDDQTTIEAVEVLDTAANTITTLPATADKRVSNYPRMHLMPSGKVFFTNQKRTQLFDPSTNTWSYVASMKYGGRGEKSNSVLLPGLNKVLEVGGSGTSSTATAEIIDFSQPKPHWRYSASMNFPRIWANAVTLPDGKVLVVGGGRGPGIYENPVQQAELFDPVTETWKVMAAQQAPRMYHSTAVLLPDGRVASTGHDKGTYQFDVEIFSPPYLFNGPRPVVDAAPAVVGYNEAFAISTRDASSISRVALIRTDSVTHSVNFDQRYLDLPFTLEGGALRAISPPTANHAPAGSYMLFAISSSGVPSIAKWVQVGSSPPPPPPSPAISGFTPTTGPPGTSVEITGTGFTGTTSVTFNGAVSTYSVNSDISITATVPAGASTGPVSVTTGGGSATSTGAFTVTPPPPSYREMVLGDGAVGYWRLGEGSGSALDQTGNAGGGTYNGVTRAVQGALASDPDPAARFDGADDYVTVPDSNALDIGDVFTYEFWVKRGAVQGTTQRILHKGGGPASVGFGINNTVVLIPGGSGTTAIATSTVSITDQKWHHIAVTKNGADVHIYIDGIDVTGAVSNAGITNNATALNIGRSSAGTGYLSGDLDEVAVYGAALSAEQVAAHYRAGSQVS